MKTLNRLIVGAQKADRALWPLKEPLVHPGQDLSTVVIPGEASSVPSDMLEMNAELRRLGYDLVRKIGRGGMGRVYEAVYAGKDKMGMKKGQTVAIKIIS